MSILTLGALYFLVKLWEITAAVWPKKIDARILVNLATGMIYTSRSTFHGMKYPTTPRPMTYSPQNSKNGTSHFAILHSQGWKITFWSRARGFETARRRFLSSFLPRESQTGSLMTSELVSFRIKTPESLLLITSSKPTRNGKRPKNLRMVDTRKGRFQGQFTHLLSSSKKFRRIFLRKQNILT